MPEKNNFTAEVFLVIQRDANDNGSRPLDNDFGSNSVLASLTELTAKITNLGSRAIYVPYVEFCGFPVGKRIEWNNRKLMGFVQPPAINAGDSQEVYLALPGNLDGLHLDVFQVQAYHPIFDGLQYPCDPIKDRHVGQYRYPFSGSWTGRVNGEARQLLIDGPSSLIDIKYKVQVQWLDGDSWRTYIKAIEQSDERTLSFKYYFPLLDGKINWQIMPPQFHSMKGLFRRPPAKIKRILLEEWALTMKDNNTIEVTVESNVEPYLKTKFDLGRTA